MAEPTAGDVAAALAWLRAWQPPEKGCVQLPGLCVCDLPRFKAYYTARLEEAAKGSLKGQSLRAALVRVGQMREAVEKGA